MLRCNKMVSLPNNGNMDLGRRKNESFFLQINKQTKNEHSMKQKMQEQRTKMVVAQELKKETKKVKLKLFESSKN